FLRFFAKAKNASLREQVKTLRASASLRRDKTVKVFYNSSVYEKVKDERVRALLRFIYTNECGEDDFSSRLSRIVEKLKESENFRSDFLAMNLHDRDITKRARQEGIKQGTQQKAVDAAKKLLAMNLGTHEQIAQAVALPLEKVKEMTEQLRMHN
ncbi:MAG: hypothetical protein IKQ43_08920, partial [Treponema sp.]|nr:hypothetical protein [Treponema sp.]